MSRNKVSKKQKSAFAVLASLVLALTFIVPFCVTQPKVSFAAYNSDYDSKQAVIDAGAKLNEKIAAEGMVLLKNDGILPLKTRNGSGSQRVSLFGIRSVNPFGGGNSNEAVDLSAGTTKIEQDIYSSLREADFIVNPHLEKQYRTWQDEYTYSYTYQPIPGYDMEVKVDASDWNIVTNAVAGFSDADNTTTAAQALNTAFTGAFGARPSNGIRPSYEGYTDAAIVVLSGTAASSMDNGRTLIEEKAKIDKNGDGIVDENDINHSRQLDAAQVSLLEEVCDQFDKVIVLINDSCPMELGFLEDSKIDAAILLGEPGANGFNVVGKMLNGGINPSGRLADIYPHAFETNPTWANFGMNFSTNGAIYRTADGSALRDDAGSVDYEEGIYVGYRYYETVAADMSTGGEDWYKENVVYPFGYGLSYTDFDWELVGSKPMANAAITEDSKISIQVKVTNNGYSAGKDVVELYYTAPYTKGTTKIEKSHVVLGDFAKTKLLNPGESEVVTLNIDAADMASYDWKNTTVADRGYTLEAGDYVLKLMKNSHESELSVTYTVDSTIKNIKSKTTGYDIKNQFNDVNTVINSTANKTVLSRGDWDGTKPVTPTLEDLKISDEEFAKRDVSGGVAADAANPFLSADYDDGKPWEVTTGIDTDDFADAATRPATAEVMLSDLIGKGYDDPLWDTLLGQLTLDECINLINYGGRGTIAIPYIGKPDSFDTDGPQGWSGAGVGGSALTKFATEPVVASTWNKDLAYELGRMIGQQGLWGNSDTGIDVKSYTGWYALAMNIHRSPFDARYKEYYSEDGVLAGMIGAYSAKGARDNGCYVYIKHFALHEDGGTARGTAMQDTVAARSSGLSVWCNEQAMREIYFKPFQITVEEGGVMGAMSAFSRIGHTWAGGSYALLTELLRNEWGFEGVVVTDGVLYSYINAQQMIRAGGDLILYSYDTAFTTLKNKQECNTPTQLAAIRKASKNILYAVANSNAMQVPQGAAIRYAGKSLSDGTVGSAYTASVMSTGSVDNEGIALPGFYWNTLYTGYSSMKFDITSGELPEGLKLDSKTGAITGTPTTAGLYTFTITASADSYVPASDNFKLNISAVAKATYAVTLNLNGGGADRSIQVTEGEKISAINQPVREGYVFTGWFKDAECTQAVDFDEAVTSGITIYAGWSVEYSSTLAVVGLIVAIAAAVAACAGLMLIILKKKKA